MNKWDFKYEEEVFDHWGYNCAGVLTNGEDFLFFHIVPDEPDGKLYCHIYNSIWMMDESEECCYLWTAENDELVTEALNNCKDSNFCGDDSIFHQIEFSITDE